jgi:hypothetical protein
LGIGENDNLTGIGGVGGDFLISGKGSIKNDFARAFAGVPVALAAEDAPVFERQNCLHCLSEEWIQSILTGFRAVDFRQEYSERVLRDGSNAIR